MRENNAVTKAESKEILMEWAKALRAESAAQFDVADKKTAAHFEEMEKKSAAQFKEFERKATARFEES